MCRKRAAAVSGRKAEAAASDIQETVMTKTLEIEGMMCGHCEKMVKRCLEKFPQISEAVVSFEAGTAVVSMSDVCRRKKSNRRLKRRDMSIWEKNLLNES